MKIDLADKVFSQYIRLKGGECARCHSRVQVNDKGLPISHHASHYFSRGKEGTRYDPSNLDCLCFACHRLWGHGDEKELYTEYKIKQLGQRGFDLLRIQANTYKKKDRKMDLIIAKELLKSIINSDEV